MNWGTKLVIAMAVCMIGIVSTVVYMVSNDTDTLEERDYYERGIDYDDVYNKKQNVLKYQATPGISVSKDSLSIRFSTTANEGKLWLRRPSDQSQDLKWSFETTGNTHKVPLDKLVRGRWVLRLDWASEGVTYFYEQSLFIE